MDPSWYYERNGQRMGPVTSADIQRLFGADAISADGLVWNKSFGGAWKKFRDTELYDGPPSFPADFPPPINRGIYNPAPTDPSDDTLIRRISDYERVSGILWIVLGIIQTLTIILAIAGIWNVIAGITRVSAAGRIQKRDRRIPSEFEGIAMLIIIGIVNFLLGGLIGLLFVGFDFYIRDLILTNRRVFTASI